MSGLCLRTRATLATHRARARGAVRMVRAWRAGECPEWAPGDRERAVAGYLARLAKARALHSFVVRMARPVTAPAAQLVAA